MKLIRWLGGKTWLKNELGGLFSQSQHEVYCEPFVGGLGSFLIYQELYPNNPVYLNDLNKHIIKFYHTIKEQPVELAKKAYLLEQDYFKDINKKEYYLEIRKQHNKNPLPETLWFLLHHAFNGIYRENQKGEYNVPYNSKVNYWDENVWLALVNEYTVKFKNVHFFNENYVEFLDRMKPLSNKTLFYFDPPYYNAGQDNDYLAGGFSLNKQLELLEKLNGLKQFIYSNHAHPTILNLLKDCNKKIIGRKNIVTSKKENRGHIKEEVLAWKLIKN